MPSMSPEEIQQALMAALASGEEALGRGAWDEARQSFEEAVSYQAIPEALEGLGLAAWWRDDAAATFEARKHAYRLYRKRGDNQSAARVAVNLAYDYYSFRGEWALADGWFQRAHRLLEGLEMVPEQCLLAVFEGTIALALFHDTPKALRLGEKAVLVGRALGVIDLEMLALAYQGMVYVNAGEIAKGMRLLDESTAAAVSGEMTNPDACANVCCFLIHACEEMRDYDRSAQWSTYVVELATRWNYALMFSLCRARYAGVVIWHGDWATAESILLESTGSLVATRPAEAAEGIVRLADLRRRQGRYDEASRLLDQAEAKPVQPMGAPLARPVRAAMALDRGDTRLAADLAERYLRGLPADNQPLRSVALELLALAQLGLGRVEDAAETGAMLRSIARLCATEALQGAASFVEGLVAAARGNLDTARLQLEDAIDLYRRNGAPFETELARIELATILQSLGRGEDARGQASQAHDALEQLGAVPAAARALALLREIEGAPAGQVSSRTDRAGLTPREVEILRLIADGRSNQEIASGLVLSVRTVERHISNIYDKLGASGPGARATATTYAHRSGLVTVSTP